MNDKELENAVAEMFRLNDYEVQGPLTISSASVDLRARRIGDPFAPAIYIEVTLSQVDNDKYSKDLTKFVAAREIDPDATCLIISMVGFTQSVIERAPNWVRCLTYKEFAEQFERFLPYEKAVLSEGALAEELAALAEVYEHPNFEAATGALNPALATLEAWCTSSEKASGWLIVVGEYGTGKTALTQMLLNTLMRLHRVNPASPIPVRIELRDFTKQFDSNSLLHKFLDDNGLGHVPLAYFASLIAKGRVVLLLDGYDEMAQYMHLLERRVCLEALARLGRDGARGILTSRPNYFSEAEELHVLETLYSSLSNQGIVSLSDYSKEKALDELFERQFLEPNERRLQDLNEVQTEKLVRRKLGTDATQIEVVLKLLRKVSRADDDGVTPLGGKPLIISYLVALADDLSKREEAVGQTSVSEYQCFKLIVDQLMRRDYGRSPAMPIEARREFLRRMAMRLSQSDKSAFGEDDFIVLINAMFAQRLERLPASERQNERQTLLADLRSSATLTRVSLGGTEGWRFSHNSLREFLVVEHLLASLNARKDPEKL